MHENNGPIYSVELLDSLPMPGGMIQAMPSRAELEVLKDKHTRVVAGFEVLTYHYRHLLALYELAEKELEIAREQGGEP